MKTKFFIVIALLTLFVGFAMPAIAEDAAVQDDQAIYLNQEDEEEISDYSQDLEEEDVEEIDEEELPVDEELEEE